MSWPPEIGDMLPRASDAWFEQIKLDEWVLAERGHGNDWQRVFQVGVADGERVWQGIEAAVVAAQVVTVRDRGSEGIICGVEVELTIAERSAPVTISWHYASKESAPRLVTAYPSL